MKPQVLKKFNGFQKPNFTQIPNELFDEILNEVSPAQFKVISYICRETFGWHREVVSVAIAVIAAKVGLSYQYTSVCLRDLQEAGYIDVIQCMGKDGSQIQNQYRIRIRGDGQENGGEANPSPPRELGVAHSREVTPPIPGTVASYLNKTTKENNTPLPPKGETEKAAPLLADQPEPEAAPNREEGILTEIAERMRKRHPQIRTSGVSVVKKKLLRILKYHKITKPEQRIEKLRRIDSNHAAHCDLHEWQKHEGQFAPKLENWLSASELRYEDPPPKELTAYGESEYPDFPKDEDDE